jgi:hypothetical protein
MHIMKPIWLATVDKIPSLSIVGHEICDPKPLTSEEVCDMWECLKKRCEVLEAENKDLKILGEVWHMPSN